MMRNATITLRLLAAVLLVLNFADFATTWVGVSGGKGVEANPFWAMLGGPLSPLGVFVKLLLVPGIILGSAWWLTRKFKDPKVAMAAILPATTIFAHAVANNVLVIVKKARKIIGRKENLKWRKEEGKELKTGK